MTAIALALAASPAWDVVSVLGSLCPLTTVALAWLVLRERASRLEWLGAAGALAGVALVSLGG